MAIRVPHGLLLALIRPSTSLLLMKLFVHDINRSGVYRCSVLVDVAPMRIDLRGLLDGEVLLRVWGRRGMFRVGRQ